MGRFIYFDLGNVLLAFDHHRSARQMAEVSGAAEEKVWSLVFAGDLNERLDAGQIDEAEFYETYCRETGTRPTRDALFWAYSDIFEPNYSIWPIVTGLDAAGHRVGLLSNISSPHWRFVSDSRFGLISQTFTVCTLSFEEHAMKPQRRIYDRAGERAGARPDEIFFVDDLPGHVAGAREAGWDAVQYTGTPALVAALRERGFAFNY